MLVRFWKLLKKTTLSILTAFSVYQTHELTR